MWQFAPRAIFESYAVANMLLQHVLVAKHTVSVTFGAPLFAPEIRLFCNRPGYVMFATMPSTMVRELAACVTFGAPRVGFLVAPCRRPMFGQPLDMVRGEVFLGNAIAKSSQSNCSWHVLPSRGGARLGAQLVLFQKCIGCVVGASWFYRAAS